MQNAAITVSSDKRRALAATTPLPLLNPCIRGVFVYVCVHSRAAYTATVVQTVQIDSAAHILLVGNGSYFITVQVYYNIRALRRLTKMLQEQKICYTTTLLLLQQDYQA